MNPRLEDYIPSKCFSPQVVAVIAETRKIHVLSEGEKNKEGEGKEQTDAILKALKIVMCFTIKIF